MSYSRIDSRLDWLKWNMEDNTRTMVEARKKLKLLMDGEDLEVAEFAPQYAEQFAHAFAEYRRNLQEYEVLVKIKKGE